MTHQTKATTTTSKKKLKKTMKKMITKMQLIQTTKVNQISKLTVATGSLAPTGETEQEQAALSPSLALPHATWNAATASVNLKTASLAANATRDT